MPQFAKLPGGESAKRPGLLESSVQDFAAYDPENSRRAFNAYTGKTQCNTSFFIAIRSQSVCVTCTNINSVEEPPCCPMTRATIAGGPTASFLSRGATTRPSSCATTTSWWPDAQQR
ncbi:hypothetical protein V5799_031657 [Amblyomma americanum]|uniref:Uncharacterized protein n=1 Tax=Amblyomma americanum TaxID=6943 RepID=A0AAQ4DTE3_AMBAM